MKRILSMLITLTILLATIPMTASALTDGDWKYDIVDNEIIITGYTGPGGNIVIPDKIRNCPVVALHGSAIFRNCESITMPDTIRTIEQVFWGSKITEITLPKSLETLGGQAFGYCQSLTFVDFSKVEKCPKIGIWIFRECKSLEKVILHKDMTEIPARTFEECRKLRSITLPKNLTHIGTRAFTSTGLTEIILPASLKVIDSGAFNGCDDLKEVIIPYGVTDLGEDFRACKSLESLYVPETVKSFHKNFLGLSENAIIYCSEGSYVESMCKSHSISYLTDNSVNSKINVLYNGKRISFHSYNQTPEIINGRTLVPLRSIFEAMGATVEWDDNTSTAIAKRNEIEIKIQIGANQIYKNGIPVSVDVPAQIMNGRTMVPVRVIAEAFGSKVEWNDIGNIVLITDI